MVNLDYKMPSTMAKPLANGATLPSKFGSTQNIAANIKVVVRVRPPNERERGANGRTVVDVVDDKMLVFDPREDVEPFFYQGVQQQNRNFLKRANKELKFMFDNVFGVETTNQDVFVATTKEILSALMDGFNCSVFVYGATGAGKTFTMIGSKEYPGITYLTMEHLFCIINSFEKEREFDIGVSYLEVYNENVFDLLKPSKKPLQLREDVKYGVMVAGLTLNSIKTARQLLDMLENGNKNRTQHPTDANAESSRSHAVFQVYVKMRYKTSGECRVVKLSMIDLAGSERASATGCVGDRFKEGANINRSLLSLGNCINKLADGSKYIPYRDSKLTRLLKDSLGGNCRTIMIANVSPSSLSYEDTYNTLKYASRANKIQLSIKKNIVDVDMHVSQYIKIVEELKKQVKELRAKAALSVLAPPASTVVVKKEPDQAVLKLKLQWRHRLEDEEKALNSTETRLLAFMSQQRILVLRHDLRQRSLAHISELAHQSSELNMKQVCTEEIPRQERAVENFTRQFFNLQQKVMTIWIKWKETKSKVNKLFEQALGECPDLSDFIKTLKITRELRLVSARESLQSRLLRIQQEEINSSTCFMTDMPNMLKKLYLILKGYDRATPDMTEEYFGILKKAKVSKCISWSDEQESDTEDMDPHFKYVVQLDLSKPEVIPMSLPAKTAPKPELLSTSNVMSDSNSDNLTEVEIPRSARKRKATPVKLPAKIANDTIVIDDSLTEEYTLNSTKVLSPGPLKKTMNGYTIDNIAVDVENFIGEKMIDPKDLNSTFVLAGKLDAAMKKQATKTLEPPKKCFTDRTNTIPRNIILPDKTKLTRPVVGKAIPFRRPPPPVAVNPTPPVMAARAPTYGPTFAKPVLAGQRNIQVGYKAVRGRERMQSHPYSRPPVSKR